MGSGVYVRVVALALSMASCRAVAGTLSGRVVDDAGAPVGGARITLTAGQRVLRAESAESGGFTFPEVEAAVYEVRVEKPGFYPLVNREFRPPADATPLDLVLNHRRAQQERVDVVYSPPAVDVHELPAGSSLSSTELTDLPYPSSHDFRNGLPAAPGVVQDGRGAIHLNGGTEDQVLYTLNGFNLTDPYTGTMENRVPVDAIREVRIQSSRYSAEFGKSSAGTLSIETASGGDVFHYGITNFLPTGRISKGFVLNKWTPHGAISGPWRRGRAWFLDAMDVQYAPNRVDELPPGANQSSRWLANNLLRNELALARGNILSSTFLLNHSQENHYGLSARDPVETTRDFRQRNYFVSVRDQQTLSSGALLEVGFAATRLSTGVYPLGTEPYRITPDGESGNYYESSRLVSNRWQGTGSVILPGANWHGRHEWKIGADLDWVRSHRFVARRPFELLRSNGTLRQRTIFTGPSDYERGNFEQSFYVQDRWSMGERAVLELGLRQDRNEVAKGQVWSPRLAFAIAPFRGRDTKFTVGWGLFYDTVNLEILTRDLDQSREDLYFFEDGLALSGSTPIRFLVPRQGLLLPRTSNFSAGFEQVLPSRITLRTGYIARRTSDALAYLDTPSAGLFQLGNRRRDRYDALEIRGERGLWKGGHWLGAYTRSSARSNAVLNLSITNPIFGRQGEGPLEWDSPHRVVSWATLPISAKYALAYLAEWRSGYPFNVFSERTGLIGLPNSHRYPYYFNLNLEMERRVHFRKQLWGLRAGFINITNHKNPNQVNNTLESPHFLRYVGGIHRAFVARVRLIGKD